MRSRSKEAPGSPERDACEFVRARGDEQVEMQAFRLYFASGARSRRSSPAIPTPWPSPPASTAISRHSHKQGATRSLARSWKQRKGARRPTNRRWTLWQIDGLKRAFGKRPGRRAAERESRSGILLGARRLNPTHGYRLALRAARGAVLSRVDVLVVTLLGMVDGVYLDLFNGV